MIIWVRPYTYDLKVSFLITMLLYIEFIHSLKRITDTLLPLENE